MKHLSTAVALVVMLFAGMANGQSHKAVDPMLPTHYFDGNGAALGTTYKGGALIPKGDGNFLMGSFCGSGGNWALGCSTLVYLEKDCRGKAYTASPTRYDNPNVIATPIVQRADGSYVYESISTTPGVSDFQYVEYWSEDEGRLVCEQNQDYLYIWPVRQTMKLTFVAPYSLR